MAIRKIIKIDEDKCNGCGLCVEACHEGAIAMEGGKAKLLRDDYCDGLGDCLPACPTEAISFEEREALAYDEAAVLGRMTEKAIKNLPRGCPGSQARSIRRIDAAHPGAAATIAARQTDSQLRQWPVQIKLAPIKAAYFKDAGLLIAADCAAYAHGNFHNEFMKNKITLIGCPKLDEGDYSEKLNTILKENTIESITVARMEVPCCGGIENAVKQALLGSGKTIPCRMAVIRTDGSVLDDQGST